MAKIIYKTVLNNIECSIELLDIEKGDKSDNTIFSYFLINELKKLYNKNASQGFHS